MPEGLPTPPPRVPPALPPVLPPLHRPPAPPGPHPSSALPASPGRRFLVGLGVSAGFAVFGIVPLVGMPGLVPLGIADAIIELVKGSSPLTRMRASSWGAALVVALLWPVPIAPAVALLTGLRPALRAVYVWLLAFGVAALWALGVAFAVLLAS